MILYLALFNLLLCAIYGAVYLIGRRPFALAMATSWAAAWLASLTFGPQFFPEKAAFAFTFLISGTSSRMALAIFHKRRAILGLSVAPLLLVVLSMKLSLPNVYLD